MHYTRHYIGTPQEKRNKALNDTREWLGEAHYAKIRRAIGLELREALKAAAGHPMRLRGRIRFCRFGLAFAGVQGYPADALVHDILRNAT